MSQETAQLLLREHGLAVSRLDPVWFNFSLDEIM